MQINEKQFILTLQVTDSGDRYVTLQDIEDRVRKVYDEEEVVSKLPYYLSGYLSGLFIPETK